VTADSFWLHLTVETGLVGLAAYLAWLWLLVVPLLAATRRLAGRRLWGADEGRPGRRLSARNEVIVLWGAGAMVFTVIVSILANTLEDALYPPLFFTILGLGWLAVRDVRHAAQPRPGHRATDGLRSQG
jgi:O-antigen ligase